MVVAAHRVLSMRNSLAQSRGGAEVGVGCSWSAAMTKAWRWTKRIGLALLLTASVICIMSEFQFPAFAVLRPQGPHSLMWLAQHTLLVEQTPGPVSFGAGVANGRWTMAIKLSSPTTVSGLRCWLPRLGDFTLSMRIGTSLSLPLWPIHILTFSCLVLWLRSRRNKPGHCPTCRYDLRGLPNNAAVCPECGAAIAPPAS